MAKQQTQQQTDPPEADDPPMADIEDGADDALDDVIDDDDAGDDDAGDGLDDAAFLQEDGEDEDEDEDDDAGEGDGSEDGEPPATDEAAAGDAAGDAGDEAPGIAGDEAAGGGEPDKRNVPKKVEQLNYELSNANRQIEELRQRIDGNPDGKPTQAQKSEIEQLTATLDQIETGLGEAVDYEFLDKKTAKSLIGSLKQVVAHNSKLQEQITDLSGATRPLVASEAQRQYWSQFDRQHPALAGGKGPELFETVRQAIVAKGFEPGTPKYEGALEVAWEAAIESAESAAQAQETPPPPATPPKGKRSAGSGRSGAPSTRSPKSTEGAVVSPRGASVAAQAAAASEHEPDDDLIPDSAFYK